MKKKKSIRGVYARINKNFINKSMLSRAVREDDITGLDLYVLSALLARAEKRGKRRLCFKSEYAILKFLKFPHTAWYYNAVAHALHRWHVVDLHSADFFQARILDRLPPVPGPSMETWIRQRKYRGWEGHHTKKSFRRILTVRLKLDELGGGLVIAFDQKFWKLGHYGYFLRAVPGVVKALRYPPEILLYFLLQAYNGKVSLGKIKLSRKIGLPIRTFPEFQRRIEAAIEKINDATGEEFQVACKSGTFKFSKSEKEGRISELDDDTYLDDLDDLDAFYSNY